MAGIKSPIPLVLVIVASIAALATAQWSEDHLGEPIFRLVYEPFEENAQVKLDRAVAIDNWNRSTVANLYYSDYAPPLGVSMQWSGNVASCTAGTTSQAYLDATFQMIGYFRTMVGLVPVTNAAGYNAGAQEAALMMSANNALSHAPPASWTCYTATGAAAAAASNLALGNAGPNAIIAYIGDSGSGNYFVGHRRWILYPLLNQFGSGSVGETTRSANCLYVFTSFVPRPATPDKVAWPPEGFVPYQVVYPRWSLSLNTSSQPSFASATVTMTEGGTPVPLSVLPLNNGYGDNTIVWEPSGLFFSPGMADRRFTVTVSGIGGPQSTVVYDVVVMDPAVSTDEIFSSGFESGNTDSWSTVTP